MPSVRSAVRSSRVTFTSHLPVEAWYSTHSIAGKDVGALRHGMAGQPGLELYGPWEDGEAVRLALVEAGKAFGLRLVGAKANSYGAKCSIGGSFVSPNIEDYYLTPWDLGYGVVVKFDHDFIGREALEKKAAEPKRQKVTLELNIEDVERVLMSAFQKEGRFKYMEFPSAVYSMHPYDQVLQNGKPVGLSTWVGYSSNDGRMLTLAILNDSVEVGSEVELVWGEENGGTKKPTVEPHVQTKIRAVVTPAPYVDAVRQTYHSGWRSKQPA